MNRCLSDALAALKEEGHANAEEHRIKHAIKVGNIDRPELDGSGRFKFADHNMNQMRDYLKNVPPRGRKPGVKQTRRARRTAAVS